MQGTASCASVTYVGTKQQQRSIASPLPTTIGGLDSYINVSITVLQYKSILHAYINVFYTFYSAHSVVTIHTEQVCAFRICEG